MVWDRKEDGGFPESKELKQRIRDCIAPEKFLGHSDKDGTTTREDCVECDKKDPVSTNTEQIVSEFGVPKPNVRITYCTGCRWLLRAAWLAQELLTTFDTEIASVTLIPSRPPAKGGTFVSQSRQSTYLPQQWSLSASLIVFLLVLFLVPDCDIGREHVVGPWRTRPLPTTKGAETTDSRQGGAVQRFGTQRYNSG